MRLTHTKAYKTENQAGYTILELVVVLLIIAILVAVLIWKNT